MNANEPKVDVLGVLRELPELLVIASTEATSNRLAGVALRIRETEAAVAKLIEVLRDIAALDPATDSNAGFNEWGEAECFNKAQEISRAALECIGGAA